MHPWNLNEDEARMLQESLASDTVLEGEPAVDTVAALDVSVTPDSRIGFAAAVLYSLSTETVIDEVVMIGDLSFPYVPGLLAFREAPLMLNAAMKLDSEPDCLMVDGHGYAHPRRFGLASHLGLILDTPSFGVAKEVLVGEYEEPKAERGEHTDIWDGEPVGYAYRSLEGANPIFLSPGHMVDIRYLPDLVEPLLNGRTKLPNPLHRAHNLANQERERLEAIPRAVGEDEPVFLVGGGLRDLLMGSPPRDYDILMNRFTDDIRDRLAEALSGSVFPLDESRGIYRISGEELQLDVTVVEEDEIINDLKRRDFTINSIALDLNQESWIDPTGGREDTEDEILRPTSEESIRSDPLRILRAYRLAQYHDLVFDGELDRQVSNHARRLTEVSKERIVEEMFELVSGPNPPEWYGRMYEDDVLSEVPFFRYEAVEDLRYLEDWTPMLIKAVPLFGETVHGKVPLVDGLKVARTIARENLTEWPLHRRIHAVARASYRGLATDPGFEVLSSSLERLCGRLIGRAIWEDWDDSVLRNYLSAVRRYDRLRTEREKQIVNDTDSDDNIGNVKERRLRDELPGLWSELVGL